MVWNTILLRDGDRLYYWEDDDELDIQELSVLDGKRALEVEHFLGECFSTVSVTLPKFGGLQAVMIKVSAEINFAWREAKELQSSSLQLF